MAFLWRKDLRWHEVLHILLTILVQKSVILYAEGVECEHRSEVCHSVLTGSQGSIFSPFYPYPYPEHTCCSWTFDISPDNILVLRLQDLDIEEDPGCKEAPCCRHSWLSLPKKDGGSHKLCGLNGGRKLLVAMPPKAIIKFYTSKVLKGGRGFNLTYSIEHEASACVSWDNHTQCRLAGISCFDESQHCNKIDDCLSGVDEVDCNNCRLDEFSCRNGDGCCSRQQLCDGNADCVDFSDEVNCGYCPSGMAACNGEHRHCFEMSQRCNGHLDCPCGEDEVNCNPSCPGKIACANGNGCFTPSDLRNEGHTCLAPLDVQSSRLLGMLAPSKFRCDNGQCISAALWCDGKDNCGDNSDEQSCVKNSVITAAIMGALTCGLLLVVAVGCMCRLYSGRLHAAAVSSAGGGPSRLGPPFWSAGVSGSARSLGRGRPPLPPPPPPPPSSDALYGREPPPAYSVAVGEADYQQLTRLQSGPQATAEASGTGRPGRRLRRHGTTRRAVRSRHPATASTVHGPAVDPAAATLAVPAASATLETSLAGEDKQQCGSLGGGGAGGSVCSSSASSTLSPSRDSLTSSTSLLSYLSGADDDAPLLVIPPS